MTDTMIRTCPSWCARVHDEAPGYPVDCDAVAAEIPQADPADKPYAIQVSRIDGDEPVLYVGDGDDKLDLAGVQRLRRELATAEQMMRDSLR